VFWMSSGSCPLCLTPPCYDFRAAPRGGFFSTAAKLAVWQTGAIRFAVELEGRDGQTPVKDAGSGTHLTPAAPPVPGVRGRDAHPLREPPHPGDAVRHGACAPEGEALRGQGLCALP